MSVIMPRVGVYSTARCCLHAATATANVATTPTELPSPPVRVRFAPSPTGLLHLGGARTALYNYLVAKKYSGQMVLRFEDTDRTRLYPGATDEIQRDLIWLGITHDEGPYTQSQRLPRYQEYAEKLVKSGDAYRCFCSPERLSLLRHDLLRRREVPKGSINNNCTVSPFRYDNRCREVAPDEAERRVRDGESHVIRFRLRSQPCEIEDVVFGKIEHHIDQQEGDPVIMKSDGYPTYHFANVVDDHFMRISHVVRGEEWLGSSVKHAQIYSAFGWKQPKLVHLPLLVDGKGRKLSKRHGDLSIAGYRNDGYLPTAVVNFLTRNSGLGLAGRDEHRLYSLDELTALFDLEKMKRIATVIDFSWLQEYGALSFQNVSDSVMLPMIRARLYAHFGVQMQTLPYEDDITRTDYILKALEFARSTQRRFSRLDDYIDGEMAFIWMHRAPNDVSGASASLMPRLGRPDRLLNDICDIVCSLCDFENQAKMMAALRECAKQNEVGFGRMMQFVRYCLSGQTSGPPVAEMLWMLGRGKALRRLHAAAGTL